MRFFRLRTMKRCLPFWLGFVFAVQVLVAVPQHAFHGAAHEIVAQHAGHEGAPPAPEDCRCDFCLAFQGLDSASALPPPAPVLCETAFSVIAAYASFEYSHPQFFSLARGPPAITA
jgi:hypothetical protein